MDYFRQALELTPENAAIQCNLGAACADQGRLDEAISAYRSALQLKPDYPEAHYNAGNALRKRGRTDEAIAAYRRALELKANFPDAHLNLGREDTFARIGETFFLPRKNDGIAANR